MKRNLIIFLILGLVAGGIYGVLGVLRDSAAQKGGELPTDTAERRDLKGLIVLHSYQRSPITLRKGEESYHSVLVKR